MDSFAIGSWRRAAVGLLILTVAGSLLWYGRTIDWGVGWTTWVPAVILIVPGLSLLRRRVLRVADGRLHLEQGWLWRRVWAVRLDGELEDLPTAGLRALILHQGGQEVALATWITAGTAYRLGAWLDARHPSGAFPRRAARVPAGDR
jgi:hypothetical protein